MSRHRDLELDQPVLHLVHTIQKLPHQVLLPILDVVLRSFPRIFRQGERHLIFVDGSCEVCRQY